MDKKKEISQKSDDIKKAIDGEASAITAIYRQLNKTTYTHNGSFNHIGKRTAIAIAVYDKAPDDEFSLIHNFQQHYTNDGVDYYNTIGIMQFGLSNVQPFYFEVLIYNALPIWSF